MVELLRLDAVAKSAVERLRVRHGVEHLPHVVSEAVLDAFTIAVTTATKALLASLERELKQRQVAPDIDEEVFESLKRIIASPEVAEEMSNLLDPGLEVFDRYRLTALLAATLSKDISEKTRADIANAAWEAFLRAFSFASRSLPELRQFLRASYEAGSFRRISDIAGAIESLENLVSDLTEQEQSLSAAISAFGRELADYGAWARSRL